VNDPLRVSVQDMELVVSIEQPGGGCRLSGGRVQNGTWTMWRWSRTSPN